MSIINGGKAFYRNLKFHQLLKKTTAFSSERAEEVLQGYLPRTAPGFTQKNEMDPQYDVMIIVPVYNVEQYLDACIDSILNQKTRYTYQAVFVDDGSTDSSGRILEQKICYPHMIIHKENGGLSSARNLALRKITGRYVMFVDSDDILDECAIECLVQAADEQGADIVEGGHTFFNQNEVMAVNCHHANITTICDDQLYGFAWGKVLSGSILSDFCFPEGYLFEDTVMSALLHPASRKSVSIPETVYHYRDNLTGITHSSKVRKASVDTFWIMKYCLEERIRREHQLTHEHYVRYLTALRRNWLRTNNLPGQVQEAVFTLSCDLFCRLLPFHYEGEEKRMALLEQTIHHKSYSAYCFLMERWDIM